MKRERYLDGRVYDERCIETYQTDDLNGIPLIDGKKRKHNLKETTISPLSSKIAITMQEYRWIDKSGSFVLVSRF